MLSNWCLMRHKTTEATAIHLQHPVANPAFDIRAQCTGNRLDRRALTELATLASHM